MPNNNNTVTCDIFDSGYEAVSGWLYWSWFIYADSSSTAELNGGEEEVSIFVNSELHGII